MRTKKSYEPQSKKLYILPCKRTLHGITRFRVTANLLENVWQDFKLECQECAQRLH